MTCSDVDQNRGDGKDGNGESLLKACWLPGPNSCITLRDGPEQSGVI